MRLPASSAVLLLLVAGHARPATLASDVSFDNTGTSYQSTNVQDALEEVDAAVLGPVAHLRDIQFPSALSGGSPHGLHWPLSDPSVTEVFVGTRSTDEGGSLAQPNNLFCVAYNFEDCGDTRIDPSEHALRWVWSATLKPTPQADELVENAVVFTADDGTTWTPWSFKINTTTARASLDFDTSPTRRALTIHENGNVAIGPALPAAPTHQLVVNGDVSVDQDLEVSGDLVVQGAIEHGAGTRLLFWGNAGNPAFDTGEELCSASGLSCDAAILPDGTPLAGCQAQAPPGVFYAMCRQP